MSATCLAVLVCFAWSAKAHNHGVKIILLLSGDFTDMQTTTGGLRALLINLQSFFEEYGYDGVDIDWEIPATAQDAVFFHVSMLGLISILPSPQLLSSAGCSFEPAIHQPVMFL